MKCNLSFSGALADVVMRCMNDLSDIEDARTRMKGRLNQAAALHGIDPGAVRRLLKYLKEQRRAETEKLRKGGVLIETQYEQHGGEFAEAHGRYVLKPKVVRLGATSSPTSPTSPSPHGPAQVVHG